MHTWPLATQVTHPARQEHTRGKEVKGHGGKGGRQRKRRRNGEEWVMYGVKRGKAREKVRGKVKTKRNKGWKIKVK